MTAPSARGLFRATGKISTETAPPQRNAWFIWDQAWRGETALRFMDRKDGRQGELL